MLHNNQLQYQVQNRVKSGEMSWNRAMDEVRADQLIKKYGKNTLLVIIHEWPQKRKYKEKPELIPSLEYLVRNILQFCDSLVKESYLERVS